MFSQFSSVQSLSLVRLFATPWTAARQASLSITNSWGLLKLMPIESDVMLEATKRLVLVSGSWDLISNSSLSQNYGVRRCVWPRQRVEKVLDSCILGDKFKILSRLW